MKRIHFELIPVLMVSFSLWAVAVQHEQHNGQTAEVPGQAETMGSMPMMQNGEMKGPMMMPGMGMCKEMMSKHQEVRGLVDKAIKGLDSIEAEKNPATLKTMLAEERAVLQKLQSSVPATCPMMEQAGTNPGMMQCPMGGQMMGGPQMMLMMGGEQR